MYCSLLLFCLFHMCSEKDFVHAIRVTIELTLRQENYLHELNLITQAL